MLKVKLCLFYRPNQNKTNNKIRFYETDKKSTAGSNSIIVIFRRNFYDSFTQWPLFLPKPL